MVEIKRVAEEWEIWDKEEKVPKLEAEAKRLVPEKFFISRLRSLVKNKAKEYPQEKFGIMQLS